MLYSSGSDLTRLQCGFVDTPEVDNIAEFIGSQRGYPNAHHLPEYIDEATEAKELDDDLDALFTDAAEVIVNHQQGSASLLQRKLKLGYNRAGRLVDQLEATGLLGPHRGSKAREVLIPDVIALEQFLSNLKEQGKI
jgi:S-DNA-T family DNA segregation ATPase FtsK/SpoIIIE